jgi:hypothetical protein
VVMNSADGSIPLPDRPGDGDGHHGESEVSKLFETGYADRIPFSERPVNKRVPTGRHRNSPF